MLRDTFWWYVGATVCALMAILGYALSAPVAKAQPALVGWEGRT